MANSYYPLSVSVFLIKYMQVLYLQSTRASAFTDRLYLSHGLNTNERKHVDATRTITWKLAFPIGNFMA